MFMAPHDQRPVGTAILDGIAVRAMLVGRNLKDGIRVNVLVVPPSLTAAAVESTPMCHRPAVALSDTERPRGSRRGGRDASAKWGALDSTE